jgi:hypothetical protein
MMSPLGCKDEATARLSYEKFEEMMAAFVANTFAFGCPLPCQQSGVNFINVLRTNFFGKTKT